MTIRPSIEHEPEASKAQFSLSPSRWRTKIAVFGTFGAGNLGNECTLQAMLYNISRYLPSAEVICICSGPEEAAADYRIPAFPIRYGVSSTHLSGVHARSNNRWARWLRKLIVLLTGPYRWYKAFKILKGKDMLIVTGLGMLGDFGISPFGLHYDILGWSIVAKLCRCELAFVSVGVGPIRDPVSRCFVKTALALGNYRSYRDRFSKEYLERIGFSTTKDRVYPDLAFSLPKSMQPAGDSYGHKSPVIGLGLIPYHGRRGRPENGDRIYRKYLASLAGLTRMLMDRGYKVRFLIGDTMYDQDVRRDLRTLVESPGGECVGARLLDEPAASVTELLLQLATTDLVVASRFHNLLLAIMLGKPVVAISYHEKIVSLMDELGLSEFCHDIEAFEPDGLIRQVTNLEKDTWSVDRWPLIERRTAEYRELLDEQYELIFQRQWEHDNRYMAGTQR